MERTKKFPWNVWMDKPEGETSCKKIAESAGYFPHPGADPRLTFSASYSHDRLEADLPGEVALQVSLELLQLSWVVDVVEGGVVKDAAS